MATPPNITWYPVSGAGSDTTTPRSTASMSLLAGDVLVAVYCDEGAGNNTPVTPTGGTGINWTLQQDYRASNDCDVALWTAPVPSDQSAAIQLTWYGVGTGKWFGGVYRCRGSDGVGNSNKAQTSGAPSVGLTTQGDNSAIIFVDGDWSGTVDNASITWRQINGANAIQDSNGYQNTSYSWYFDHYGDAGAAGAKTCGMTAPGGQTYSILVCEIKGAAVSWTPQVDAPEKIWLNTSSMIWRR